MLTNACEGCGSGVIEHVIVLLRIWNYLRRPKDGASSTDSSAWVALLVVGIVQIKVNLS